MIAHKLNESYSALDGTPEELQQVHGFLRVERPGAYFEPLVKRGFKSPFHFFASPQNGKLMVLNGHLSLLQQFGVAPHVLKSDYTERCVDDFLVRIMPTLPFEPWDFQIRAFRESILGVKQVNRMCTSSGKSLVIALLAEFFRQHGKRGLLLVPNINLLTQFKGDINDYSLDSLHSGTHIIGGGSTERHFSAPLTISTWQSLREHRAGLEDLDFVITDEAHRFTSDVTSSIVKNTVNCRYKWGFTGTLPDDPVQRMELLGLFGLPQTYITSRELIERSLATPIKINAIILRYSKEDRRIFKEAGKYPQQVSFLKDHPARNRFIVNLTTKLRGAGNTLVLFQHTLHGKGLFIDVMKALHPSVKVLNKNITGKKSFEFQQEHGVYFLNGEDNPETRERTRQILEQHSNATLIANYALLSTGVSIKRLHNMVLASPLKSFTTISQSIGRMMRKHPSKDLAQVFDLVDSTNIRTLGGPFYKQYQHRQAKSYNPEDFPITEREFNLHQGVPR